MSEGERLPMAAGQIAAGAAILCHLGHDGEPLRWWTGWDTKDGWMWMGPHVAGDTGRPKRTPRGAPRETDHGVE